MNGSESLKLQLAREPVIIAPSVLPGHRILRLHLRNAGEDGVELRRTGLRLLDDRGEDLRAASRPPLLRLEPGGTGAMDLVYRVREGLGPPAHLEHAGEPIELTSARLA